MVSDLALNVYDLRKYYLHIRQIPRGNPRTSRRACDGPSLSFYCLQARSVLGTTMEENALCVLQAPYHRSMSEIE